MFSTNFVKIYNIYDMTNKWIDISPNFTPELQKEWEDLNFTYLEVQDWIKEGGLTIEEAGFAFFLKEAGFTPEKVKMTEKDKGFLDNLREDYRENPISQPTKLEDWQSVNANFTPNLVENWKHFGFSLKETKEWISIGVSVDEASFCAWLSSYKSNCLRKVLEDLGEIEHDLISAEQVLNYGNYQELKNEYQQYLNAQQVLVNY